MVGVLIRMKVLVTRHALTGQRALAMLSGALVGLALAGGTLLLGLADFDDPATTTDVLAAVFMVWALGWALLPVLTGGGDDLLRPQHFRLLPLTTRQLSAGLLVASLVGVAPAITLVAFTGLVVHAAGLGAVPVAVAVAGVALQFGLVLVLSKVVTGALGAVLTSRRGRDVGLFVLVLVACVGWLIRFPLESLVPRLVDGEAPGFATVVRALPTGWASVAVEAAADSDWPLVLGPLAGLAALFTALVLTWAALLGRRMTTVPAAGGRGGGTPQDEPVRRLLPATPTGGVVGKEVRTWFRDIVRNVSLLGVLVASVFVALAPVVLGSAEILPYGGLGAVMIAAMFATNLYGLDGGALWLTLVAPSAERADVRGRQWAWLLIIGPVGLVLTVVPTALSGEAHHAFPWVLAALPALLGGGAGLAVLLSVLTPYPMPDQRAGNPLAFRSRFSGAAAAGALAGVFLLVLAAAPACAVVLLGVLTDSGVLTWLGVPVGLGTGALLFWWWGGIAHRRLRSRGPELFQLVRKAA